MAVIYKSVDGRESVQAQYAELLGRRPVPCEHLRVPTCEGKTFVIASGPAAAPPILLLQGSGANAAMWLRDVTTWAHTHRVYAVDVIGEPGFSAPSRPPLTSAAYARWLDDVMQALGTARASFVGVSLGGWLALDYAIRRPERVDRVVAISPGGVGAQRASFVFKALGLMLLGRWGRRKAMALALGIVPATSDTLDREIGALAQLIAKHFRYRRDKMPIFSDETLKRVTMPVLTIVGAKDALLDSHGTKDRLERCAPCATVSLLPDVGHLIRGQASAVLEFLARPTTARATDVEPDGCVAAGGH
jgi:pimeloyl-ACP methyl ester carboxylesterase